MNPKKLDNLKKLVSKNKSGWLEKAKWREENESWLDKSAKIAILIISEIEEQKKTKGMSQKKLAEKLDVSPQYINKLLKGQENLTLETISKIEDVLGISLIEIPSFTIEEVYTDIQLSHNAPLSKFNAQKVAGKSYDYTPGAFYVNESETTYKPTGS